MAVITPNTDVILLKVPLEIDENNQLDFANAEAQYNYFNSLPKLVFDNNFTYQRKDGVMRVPALYDDVITFNYVMYRNNAYDDKWFYAFIQNAEYINDSVTALTLKTDTWQTWQFDLRFKPVFVEREHVNDDTTGIHTIPENLETGEFVRSLTGSQCSYSGNFWLAFQVTELISNMAGAGTGNHRLYNGIYSGLYTVLIDNYTTADLLVSAYDDAGKHDAIIACFYIPKNTASSVVTNSACVLHGTTCTIYFPNATSSAVTIDSMTIPRPTTIDGYTPKNNKLFTREYCYMLASNNSGSEAVFYFEDFRDISSGLPLDSAGFIVRSVLTQGGSTRLIPDNNYKAPSGVPSYTSFNSVAKYGLTAGKLPICSWNSDYYTNWLTQNAVNMGVSAVETGLAVGSSLIHGDVIGATSSLISGIGEQVNRSYQASLVPNQAKGNTNCGDINFSEGLHMTVTTMTVRAEYAKMIDDYFSMFGYKVNTVKIPNITGRRNWNFVKTQGSYIEADIPESDLSEIKGFFDRGITFWHNPATFADYTQNNDII